MAQTPRPEFLYSRVCLSLCLGALLFLWTGAVLADHPSPLPDAITTPNIGYTINYTDNSPYNPDPDGDGFCSRPVGADANYFPTGQATIAANSLDNDNANLQGNPNGNHAGTAGAGFLAPSFAGGDGSRPTDVKDCSPHGGCDSGNAPEASINLPAFTYICASDPCIRLVLGHELFHHTQYAYISFGNWVSWGSTPVEGTARMMQDKIYSDLDADDGCITYLGAVEDWMNNPDRDVWASSYTSALWWNYLSEQFGTPAAEPGYGVDFIRTFWERAQANNTSPNTPETVRESIALFDNTAVMEDVYLDFSIANIAREFDVSALPEAIKYRYQDENDGSGSVYQNVARDWDGAIVPNKVDALETVSRWGSKYYEATLLDCTGIVGFKSDTLNGTAAGYGLLAIRDRRASGGSSVEVERISKGRTTNFAKSLINPSSDPYSKLVAVVSGFDDEVDYDYAFACGQPSLQIVRPTLSYLAYAGEPATPERFMIRLVVAGPSELGVPTVQGLDPSYFNVYVGTVDPANAAVVLSGAEVQGEYWLVVQAPGKVLNGSYDLTVELESLASATMVGSVLYEKKVLDEMLVIDRSGSMLSPAGFPKIDAAKSAASLFVDATNDDDQVGVVSFGGDNNEVNDDATLEWMLGSATDAQRASARAAVSAISIPNTSVLTSIGDGLEKARVEFVARGSLLGEDVIILMSDGMENEGNYVSTVLPNLVALGVEVHSIALGPQSNQALLQQVATDTGGTYYYVDVGTTTTTTAKISPNAHVANRLTAKISPNAHVANRLSDAYLAASEAAHDSERLWEEWGTLSTGGAAAHLVSIKEIGVESALWSFHWADPANAMTVIVTDPFHAELKNGVNGVRIHSADTHIEIHVPTLSVGDYQVALQATAGTPEYIGILSGRAINGVNMALYFGQTIDSTVHAAGGTFAWGASMPLVVSLTDTSGGVSESYVSADVQHPDGSEIVIELFDDGGHGDGNPDDGVYGALYRRTTQGSPTGQIDGSATPAIKGSYNVAVRASGFASDGQSFDRIRKASFQVFVSQENTSEDRDSDGMPDVYEDENSCLDSGIDDSLDDVDFDGLNNLDEWRIGINPCNIDTDLGGEHDGSEVARGANPFGGSDDAMPRPTDPEVITHIPDHIPDSSVLVPGANVIRYPSSSAYTGIRIWRSTLPNGPFAVLAEIAPNTPTLYVDAAVAIGSPYYYRVQGIGALGTESAWSHIFSGTPQADPYAPVGRVSIAGGAAFTDNVNVDLQLKADDSDVVNMWISDRSNFAGAVLQAYAEVVPWSLSPSPAPHGLASVFVQYFDTSGNGSSVYHDSIRVVPSGNLGKITGRVQIVTTDPAHTDDSGAHVVLVHSGSGAPTNFNPVFTDAFGEFVFKDIPAGSYDVRVTYKEFPLGEVSGAPLPTGSSIDVGTVTISELGAPSMPQITNIEPGDAQVSISVSVADDGGSPITGYNAYCFGDRLLFGASPTSPIAVSGLTNGVSYTCAVTATNDVGESPASAFSEPVTPVAPAPGC